MDESDGTASEFQLPEIDTPLNLRPDLTLYGIEEVDRGVCEDTAENRQTLRKNKMTWIAIYDDLGHPTDTIEVRSQEMITNRGLQALEGRKAILEDPRDKNSEYLTGYDLLYADLDNSLIPGWIVAATRAYVKLEEERAAHPEKKIKAHIVNPPARCCVIKSDGVRCLLWTGGRRGDNQMCRVHLASRQNTASGAVEKARMRLAQGVPMAVDVLEEMMHEATSEPVRLKAASEWLDRAGVRGGVEIDMNATLEVKPAGEVLRDRMEKLRMSAETVHELTASPATETSDDDVEYAEVVEENRDEKQ